MSSSSSSSSSRVPVVPNTTTTIHSLPNELLSCILEKLLSNDPQEVPHHETYELLRSCALVDRRWNQLATPILWRSPLCRREHQLKRLFSVLHDSTVTPRPTAHPYARMVQRLAFGHFMNRTLTDSHIQAFLHSCGAHIRSINLGNCQQLTGQSVQRISTACQDLQSFYLEDTWERPRYSQEAFLELFQCCPELRDVGLYRCRWVDARVILALARSSQRRLQRLVLFDCGPLSEDALEALRDCCTHLQTIHITSRYLRESPALRSLAEQCPNVYIQARRGSSESQQAGETFRILKNPALVQCQVERGAVTERTNNETVSIF